MTQSALWQPTEKQIKQTNLHQFKQCLADKYDLILDGYADIYKFSISQPEKFWLTLWNEYSGQDSLPEDTNVLINKKAMPGAVWFPDVQLNYAQCLLRSRPRADNAIIFRAESQFERELSYGELYDLVSKTAQAMRDAGVKKGDRVAAMMPNMPETIIFMLAATSIGAIWASCSPDFGAKGVVDRFGQIEPVMLIAVNGYFYNGKTHSCIDKCQEIASQIDSIKNMIIVPYSATENDNISAINHVTWMADFIQPFSPKLIDFEPVEFNHPLYIMFSSGTTGVPKCIVHGTGGTLLQHLKELVLHTDVKPNDHLFYFTTCGWMMWNWMVSGLACGAVLMLYDGSPFYPGPRALFTYAEKYRMNIFGTSAKYIEAIMKSKRITKNRFDLSSLKTMLSTGSPLSPEGFRFVYQNIKEDICLSSISGGTDIVSCFALGCPILPVYEGQLQCVGLGMNVKALNDDGSLCDIGEKGELACLTPFPCMPVGFWNDDNGQKYYDAYFSQIDNVWCHGDYIELTPQGGMIIHGRSDAVLNPGGVRIGTAEIYRQVEKLDQVLESIVIGQRWDNDVRVVLFVKLADGISLSDQLIDKIKLTIRQNTTPRHVPELVLSVADIPRTKSGKIVELAVKNIVHNEVIKNKEALANPEALEYFSNRPELMG